MSFRAPAAAAAAALAIGCGGPAEDPAVPVYGAPAPDTSAAPPEADPPPDDGEGESGDPAAPPEGEGAEPAAPMYGGPPTATPPPEDPGETKAMYGFRLLTDRHLATPSKPGYALARAGQNAEIQRKRLPTAA